jgi:hypothetical protein
MIKDHVPTLAMLAALTLLLIAILVLASEGSKSDGPLLIGLSAAVGTITGAIAGKQIGVQSGSTNGGPKSSTEIDKG